jgi:hypothetical protein
MFQGQLRWQKSLIFNRYLAAYYKCTKIVEQRECISSREGRAEAFDTIDRKFYIKL